MSTDEVVGGARIEHDSYLTARGPAEVQTTPETMGLNDGSWRCHGVKVGSWACRACAKASTEVRSQGQPQGAKSFLRGRLLVTTHFSRCFYARSPDR